MFVNLSFYFISAGYPQALSSKLNPLTNLSAMQKPSFFPELATNSPWTTPTTVKRYNLTFPYYPFRTLAPRDMHLARQSESPFDTTSPLFPAHTQINLTFKRRPKTDLLNYMLGENLNVNTGCSVGTLSDTQRAEALKFGGAGQSPATSHSILSVSIKLTDIYLLVRNNTPFPPPPPPPFPPFSSFCYFFFFFCMHHY